MTDSIKKLLLSSNKEDNMLAIELLRPDYSLKDLEDLLWKQWIRGDERLWNEHRRGLWGPIRRESMFEQ
jgi:hypothetical protein